METYLLENLRAVTEPIDRILNAMLTLATKIFGATSGGFANDSYMRMLLTTILQNNYLLISVSLMLVGFIISILGRLIRS